MGQGWQTFVRAHTHIVSTFQRTPFVCPSEFLCANVLPIVMHSPSHGQASAPVINIQSTFHTSPNLCENVSHALLFGNSRKITHNLRAVRYMYIHIDTSSLQCRDTGRAK